MLDLGPPEPESLDGTETLLLVEDDEEVRALVLEILQLHGYMVLGANNVSEAIAISEHHPAPIHLLVTDVVMPGMSGPALVERLMPARPEMKVLYMSGYTGTALHAELEQSACFLEKPFTSEALAAAVRRALGSPGEGASDR